MKADVERLRAEREHRRERARVVTVRPQNLKSIDVFRADARYGGDGTRVDLAYSVYALSHGAIAAEVEAAIRSRNLSHKGSERWQNEYVERTIRKALATIGRGR